MSTSDAGRPELRVVGGETERRRPERTAATREYQDDGRFWGNDGSESAESNPPGVKQKETHKALKADGLRKVSSDCDGSDVQIQSSGGSSFTSCLLLTLSKPELRLRRTLDLRSALQSRLIEPQLLETEGSTFQVNGRTSSSNTCIETSSVCSLSETVLFPARKEEVITSINHERGVTRDLTKTPLPSNGNFRSHEQNGSHIPPCVSGTETEKDIKHRINLYNSSHLEKLSDSSGSMLSSTMVTVLASPWGVRPRRPKRSDGTGNSDAQGDSQEVPSAAETPNQYGVKGALRDGLHTSRGVPFLGGRRNTVGWSTKSDPSSLDFESKRIMTQTVSLDSSAASPSPTPPSPWSPHLHDPDKQRRNPQVRHQSQMSPLDSKPTSSSLLLSLRSFNSNTTNSNTTFVFPGVNDRSLSTSTNDQNGKWLTKYLPPTSPNNNEQLRSKAILSPSSSSYSTAETGPVLPPASSSQRERNLSNVKNISFTQQTQTNTVQTSLTSSKHSFQDKRPSEEQQSSVGSDNTNLYSDTFMSSPRHSPYDHCALFKTRSLPRRTTLTSTSWWKQVSQEASSLSHNDTTNIKDKSGADSPCLTDNKRLLNNRDNNNTSESAPKGNMNLTLKTHLPESDRLVKQSYGLNVDNREPQKPHSVPDCLPTSKISSAVARTTLRQTDHPVKNLSDTSFTSNLQNLPLTSYNSKTSNPTTDGSSKFISSLPKANRIPLSPHNTDPQRFITPSRSHDVTNSQTTSVLPTSPNTKNTLSSQSSPVYPKTSANTSLSQTPKFSNKADVTPLGFERSYVCLPKPFRPKNVSSLISPVDLLAKTKGSPVSSSPTAFSATSPRSSSVLSPSVTSPTSVTASTFLTPPATPVNTSPNSETTTPKIKSIFNNSPDKDSKKSSVGVEGKKERRVTWGDSVDVQFSEPVAVEKSDSFQAQKTPLSPSSSPRNVPSIFSLLRSGSSEGCTAPVSSHNPKTFNTQVGKGEKYRSLSSDSADLATREREKNKHKTEDTLNFDRAAQALITPRQERTLSMESGTVQCRSSSSLSLPPDFSSGLKLRYSVPPYSTLMSSRQIQGEKKPTQSSSISKSSQLNSNPQTSSNNNLHMTPKPLVSPIQPSQPPLTFQRATSTPDSSICKLSDTDKVNNNHIKGCNQSHSNSQIQLLDNRVLISSQSLSGDDQHTFSSTYVTETLIYSIKSKVDTAAAAPMSATPKPLQQNTNTPVSVESKSSQQSDTVQGKKGGQSSSRSDQSSVNTKSTESFPCSYESNRSTKETVLGNSRFYSVEVENDQNPKKSRFALKRSVSSPNSNLPRGSKSNNKMDEMFNRLKQKFSTKRSDEDSSFPWKWRRSSQTPSVSGSDVSSVSDNSADSFKTLEERVQEKGSALNDAAAKTDDKIKHTENRYTIVPALTVGESKEENEFSVWSEEASQDDLNVCPEQTSKSKDRLTVHMPANQFDSYKNNEAQCKAANQFFPGSDPDADGNPIPAAAYPTQSKKSTPSPRSPFSPFSSLSPLSPFSPPDVTDDSVFYSPKLQRRREPSSPYEPREGISLGGSRRRRASTGPPSASPSNDKEQFASSYADLKYGIVPGRSFSVSSVLSSRPLGPGRISTGSRVMSVGDISQSALTCAGGGKDVYQCFLTPDWTGELNSHAANDSQISSFLSDNSKIRSRSLPRSWTRCLANWSSDAPPSQCVSATTSKPALCRSPTMNTCHFAWDTEGPPTPPLTPPLSPVSRRMSRPPSLTSPSSSSSSSAFSSSPGAVQQVDGQSSRGHLPSRGYVSSLSTFDESSDSSSDTTTDDEYYLETGGDGEKETEL